MQARFEMNKKDTDTLQRIKGYLPVDPTLWLFPHPYLYTGVSVIVGPTTCLFVYFFTYSMKQVFIFIFYNLFVNTCCWWIKSSRLTKVVKKRVLSIYIQVGAHTHPHLSAMVKYPGSKWATHVHGFLPVRKRDRIMLVGSTRLRRIQRQYRCYWT